MAKTFNLSVIFKVVDKATVPMKKVAKQMSKIGGPIDKVKMKIKAFGAASVRVLKRVGQAARKAGAKIRAMAGGMAIGLVAAGAAAVLVVKQMADMADVIGKTADRIGITTDELQKLRHAGELTGLSTAEMDKSLEQFNRRLGEAQDGTGELYDGLVKLKIGLKDSNGNLKPMRQLLDEVADKTASMTNETAKADILYGMFGRSGIKMINTLKGGSKGLKDSGDELERTGGIMDGKMIRSSEKFNDTFLVLKKSVQGFTATALVPLLPFLTDIAKSMTDWIGNNKDWIKGFGEMITTGIKFAVAFGGAFVSVGKFIGETIAKIVGGIEKLIALKDRVVKGLKQTGSDQYREKAITEADKTFPGLMGTPGTEPKQQTEIKIKVVSDKDSTATVEQIMNVSGNPNVNIATEAYVGAH